MNIKKPPFRIVVVALIPFVFFLIMLYDFPSMLAYVPLLLLFLDRCLRHNFYVQRQYFLFGAAMILMDLLSLLLSRNLDTDSLLYIGLIALFWFTIPDMGEALAEAQREVLYVWVLTFLIFLIPKIIIYSGSITPSLIKSAFLISSDESRTRLYFDFAHPNTAAFTMACNIIICCRLFLLAKRKSIKVLLIIDIVLTFLGLLGTGSRTALISVVVFLLMTVITAFGERLSKLLKQLFYIIIVLLVIFIVIGSSVTSWLSENSSGRMSAYGTIIGALSDQGYLLFGAGITSISAGELSSKLGVSVTIDGWYAYMLASVGIAGFVVILAVLFYVFVHFYRKASKENKGIVLTLEVAFLCYGFAENVIFTPGVILSVICWALLYAGMADNMQMTEVEDEI